MHASSLGALLFVGIGMAAGAAITAAAQSPLRRDPTVPPPTYGAQPPKARDPMDAFRPEHLVTVDGKRYLMWRGRRYGAGDSIEGARIERLDETEVWLRTERGMRKLALFPGIQKLPTDPTR